jgi:MOSC domain-containing protein YiiM
VIPLSSIRLLSIQVALPRTHGNEGAREPLDRAWTTAFFKEPVAGPVWLGRANLAGDRQADTKSHGGPDKAVLAYAAAHYPLWRAELGVEMPFGAFGENFTVAGLDEGSVCLGDVYAVGGARVQVSQPRIPCWKIARRWRRKDLSARVQATGRTGWYLRVLDEGAVAPGDEFGLLERPHPEWTVARANRAMYVLRTREAVLELAACPALAPSLAAGLRQRAAAPRDGGDDGRLLGPNED